MQRVLLLGMLRVHRIGCCELEIWWEELVLDCFCHKVLGPLKWDPSWPPAATAMSKELAQKQSFCIEILRALELTTLRERSWIRSYVGYINSYQVCLQRMEFVRA